MKGTITFITASRSSNLVFLPRMRSWIRRIPSVLVTLFFVLGPHPRHMEVPRLGVESRSRSLQLPAYTTATATPDLNHIFDPGHSLWEHRILNLLSEARDQTPPSQRQHWVLNPPSHIANSQLWSTTLVLDENTLSTKQTKREFLSWLSSNEPD